MAREPDAEALLARLVAFPTVPGASNADLIDWVAELLAAHGVEAQVLEGVRPGTATLLATIGPPDAPGVVLAAHSDVVTVDGQRWSHDPFTLTRVGERLHGRGATDMKGFLAAALAVVPHAVRSELRRPLHLAVSADEEVGCRGAGPLLDALAALPARPAYVVVGEPTELDVAVQHKGKAALRATVRGRAYHSGLAPLGVNAVAYAARLIVALEELGARLAETRATTFSVPHATLSVGPIAGGVAVNIVPDQCAFELELRSLPGQPVEQVVEEIERRAASLAAQMRRVAPEAGIAVERIGGYPALAPVAGDGTAAQVAALAGGDHGLAVDFGTEAGLYRERLGVPVVVCGPGSMRQGHQPDEYLEAGQLRGAEAFLRRLVETLAA